MQMKVSDYIVEFLIHKGILDVFGYPGGMVTHLIDSFSKYKSRIQAHVCCHEQAAAFAACGYAQANRHVGVAYATSGPGATNLMTGICNAYFDSIPVIFITGQVNTFESRQGYAVRQRGFQETDIISMASHVTKYAVYVAQAGQIGYFLEKAYQAAVSGRKGPVLLDIPMDIQHAQIDSGRMERYRENVGQGEGQNVSYPTALQKIGESKRPCLLLGAGLKWMPPGRISRFVGHMGMPAVTSMPAVDLLEHGHPLNYGFIGTYGARAANFIVAKSDLILALGSRMDVRQVGAKREDFAPDAAIIRVDVDKDELGYPIREDELPICADVFNVMEYLEQNYVSAKGRYAPWIHICNEIVQKLQNEDKGLMQRDGNAFVKKISGYIPEDVTVTTDVGQNQVWVAQSFLAKGGRQRILFSGGHGAMGYSLPAAIGAYYATGRTVVCFCGDGGFQMNMQELGVIQRECLPVKIFVFNNFALGMIRHFQEMYFGGNYVQTVCGEGYSVPDFKKVADAYGMKYLCYESIQDVTDCFMKDREPVLVEVKLMGDTYVFPKLEFGKQAQDQEPLLDRQLYQYLMGLS